MRRWLLPTLLLGLASCQFLVYEDFRDEASIRTFERPNEVSASRAFGQNIVAATLTRPVGATTQAVSRFAIGGGPGDPVAYYTGWDFDGTQSDPARQGTLPLAFSRASCKDQFDPQQPNPRDCDTNRHSSALALIDSWDFDGPGPEARAHTCLVTASYYTEDDLRAGRMAPDGNGGRLRIRCEDRNATLATARPSAASGFGASLAVLPAPSPDNAVLLIGATGDGNEPNGGQLYRLRQDVAGPEPIANPADMPALDQGDRFGANLAVFSKSMPMGFAGAEGAPALVLVAVPEDEGVADRSGRAFAMAYGSFDEDDDPMTPATEGLRMVGCIDDVVVRRQGSAEGQGMTLGDADNDGFPEFYIGTDNGIRWGEIDADYALGTGCAAPDASDDATQTIACPAVDANASCTGAGFGADIAMGDLDHDGIGDLVVGAPNATVDGAANAGGIWVLKGAADLSFTGVRVLYPAGLAADARLGSQVEILQTNLNLPGQERDEVLGGAPGVTETYLFLCTGIPGDEAVSGNRCL